VDGLKRFRNHHSGYQVDLHFEGLNINLIYMKKQVLTASFADTWPLLIACIPIYGMPFHVRAERS